MSKNKIKKKDKIYNLQTSKLLTFEIEHVYETSITYWTNLITF